jgi:hypothetical protein
MFYLSLAKIKPFAMCSKGPEIIKYFEERFDEEAVLPLQIVLDKWGETHAVFCLRAVEDGPEFALTYATDCVDRVRDIFNTEFVDNPLFDECLKTVLERESGSSMKEAGHNMESFCLSNIADGETRDKAIKAGMAASKLSYAAYTLSQPHASVDFSLGAIEDSCQAASNTVLENCWQEIHFKELLLSHKDE